jgi:ribosomal protein L15
MGKEKGWGKRMGRGEDGVEMRKERERNCIDACRLV